MVTICNFQNPIFADSKTQPERSPGVAGGPGLGGEPCAAVGTSGSWRPGAAKPGPMWVTVLLLIF